LVELKPTNLRMFLTIKFSLDDLKRASHTGGSESLALGLTRSFEEIVVSIDEVEVGFHCILIVTARLHSQHAVGTE
jgi:hypothetical protein